MIMKQVFDTMSEATGVDFTEIMRAGTYDAKVNRKIDLTGAQVVVQAGEESGKSAGSDTESKEI